MKTLEETFLFAQKAHFGQKRRDGSNYFINHVIKVWERVRDRFADERFQMVALLHDTSEDCEITEQDLIDEGFEADVIEAVMLLTKKKGQSYKQYLHGIVGNEFARQVKIQDMIHNLSDDPTERQIKKYSEGLSYLAL